MALDKLGYNAQQVQVKEIGEYIDENETIEGRPTRTDKKVLRGILTEQVEEILSQVTTPEQDITELFEELGLDMDAAVPSALSAPPGR
jgi:hypothetical protein